MKIREPKMNTGLAVVICLAVLAPLAAFVAVAALAFVTHPALWVLVIVVALLERPASWLLPSAPSSTARGKYAARRGGRTKPIR